MPCAQVIALLRGVYVWIQFCVGEPQGTCGSWVQLHGMYISNACKTYLLFVCMVYLSNTTMVLHSQQPWYTAPCFNIKSKAWHQQASGMFSPFPGEAAQNSSAAHQRSPSAWIEQLSHIDVWLCLLVWDICVFAVRCLFLPQLLTLDSWIVSDIMMLRFRWQFMMLFHQAEAHTLSDYCGHIRPCWPNKTMVAKSDEWHHLICPIRSSQ